MDQPKNVPDVSKINFALSRLEKVILDSIDFREVTQKICDSIFYELDYLRIGYRIVVLALVDEKKQLLKRVAISRTSKAEIAIAALTYPFDYLDIPLSAKNNFCIKAMDEKKPFITHYWPDILTPPLTTERAIEVQMKSGIKTTMIFPLLIHDKTIGIMIFSMIKNENEVLPEEKELLLRFADIAALAVQNSSLYSSLEKTSEKLKDANVKLREVDKLKDEFLSLASHELRTPMTAIKSYLWMVLQGEGGKITEKQASYLNKAYNSTSHLIVLVNDMLDVSRIESGRVTLNLSPTKLDQLVDDAVAEITPRATELEIEIVVIPFPSLLPSVLGDFDKIKEVLINLIGNSLKFTPKKGKITIGMEQNDGMVETSVTDTGVGIKKEDIPKLFQKFSMVGGSEEKALNSQGTGLGLYICKSIIEFHGGKIWAASDGIGKGATFTFSLKVFEKQPYSKTAYLTSVK
jgi:signal transduction histidine kinase